jgi:hypothetical protein
MGTDDPEWRLERALLKELRRDSATLAVVTQLHLPSRRRPDLVAVMATPDGGACLLVVELKPRRADMTALSQLLDYLAEIRTGLAALGVSMPIAGALAAPAFHADLVAWLSATTFDPPVRLITVGESK